MNQPDHVLVLRDVLIPGGRVTDITCTGGTVAHVGSSGHADVSIRCAGMMVIPAGVDMHVHMRDTLQAYKEDWKSGTQSALAGGVTVVVDQPNTMPAITTPDIFQSRVRLAQNHSFCHFGINAGVTPQADIEGMASAGAMAFGETFAGPSSYGEALSPGDLKALMERITRIQGLMTMHAEVVKEGRDINLRAHNELRSGVGEGEAIRMIHEIAPDQAQIHFCHISCAESLDEVHKIPGATTEVTPHHLFLSLDLLAPDSTKGKVNPPIRTEAERKNLWRAWQKIDVIGSDHAPHSLTDKAQSFESAPSGIPGVETMIPLLMARVVKKSIPLPDIIHKTSTNPAKILGIPPAGYEPGMRADFALYHHDIEKIQGDLLSSKAGWTPFEGMDAVFPRLVILGGAIAYHEGTFTRTQPQWLKGRGYNS